jgi:transposase-like protein
VGAQVVLIALGIDERGDKHVLGLYEGATENATVCTALLADLCARGLRTDRTLLFVIDGSKALVKAIRNVAGKRALTQRCQVHKKRNVEEHLPESMKRNVGRIMTAAYHSSDPERARRMLERLARQLDKQHPAAAASMREGLEETLTVANVKLDPWLARTLSTTNPLEFINGRIVRHATTSRDRMAAR